MCKSLVETGHNIDTAFQLEEKANHRHILKLSKCELICAYELLPRHLDFVISKKPIPQIVDKSDL
jgi:hypothetical protein